MKVIVTGASGGIGRGIATVLAGSGCAVGVLARSGDKLESLREEISAAGGTCHASAIDLRSEKEAAAGLNALAEALGQSDPKRRLPWFGPDMGVQMFTTARYMETWAHGQEIYDLAGAKRNDTDRIENIATIGMKTFGWTFVNRKLEIPGPPPYVRLVAPSGAIWEWNDPSETECVRGDAVDFCHVVTQGRNIADTGLEVAGPVATQWMAIAQCFAGGPVDPPKPGTRG